MGRPFAVFEGDLVARIIDGLAVLECLQEQAEAGGDAESDERTEFHCCLPSLFFPEVWYVGGTVVLALPMFEQLEV